MAIHWKSLENGRLLAGRLMVTPVRATAPALGSAIGYAIAELAVGIPSGWRPLRVKARTSPGKGARWNVEMILVQEHTPEHTLGTPQQKGEEK